MRDDVPCYSRGAVEVMSATIVPAPNPWRTMWFSPRITMRHLAAAETVPSWAPVVALAALSSAMGSLQLDPETGALSASRSTMPVIIGVLQLIFGVLVGPFLLALVGGSLGGEADADQIRNAVAWSYVPIAVGTVLWVPLLFVLGTSALGDDFAPQSALQWLVILLALGIPVTYVWSLPLLVASLAEVQRFSIGKAVLNVCILAVPVILMSAFG